MARPADHEARGMAVIGKVILIFTLKTETTMKKSILCLLFAIAAMAWANDAAAQQCKKKMTPRVESTVAKGKMPPRWLLNKVTPAQYDTLVALNRLCTVDYSMLKGYKVTPQMVEKVMGQARKYLREAMDRHDGVVPRVGWTTLATKTLTTWTDKTEKCIRTVEYLVGSSADGYDVHLLLRATLQRDRRRVVTALWLTSWCLTACRACLSRSRVLASMLAEPPPPLSWSGARMASLLTMPLTPLWTLPTLSGPNTASR